MNIVLAVLSYIFIGIVLFTCGICLFNLNWTIDDFQVGNCLATFLIGTSGGIVVSGLMISSPFDQ